MAAHDATIHLDPVALSGARIAVLSDPDGHQIELVQRQD